MDVVVCGDLLYIITLAITICPIILPFTPHVSKKKKKKLPTVVFIIILALLYLPQLLTVLSVCLKARWYGG